MGEQSELFFAVGDSSVRQTHLLGDSSIEEFPFAFNEQESADYLAGLIKNIPWQQDTIRIAGKEIPVPRLQCWMGDRSSNYGYSGIRLEPTPWFVEVRQIKDHVETLTEQTFNSVLLNYYRNGQDSVAWHADDEKELGNKPVIASVSFGAVRKFQFRSKQKESSQKFQIDLRNGSVLLMGDSLQDNWLHQLPKVPRLNKPRINLTFRRIV